MKRHTTMTRCIHVLLPLLFVAACADEATDQAEPETEVDYLNESEQAKDARMEWWREARFGMFIHWGLYAVPAGTYEGERIPGIGEWIMERADIPVAEYERFADQFNPVEYDPDEWVRIAKDAGMKYIIITSKHHDGFSLWDSEVSDYDVVDATPYGRDLLRPLADAAQREGIRLGFYHSIMDWHHPDAQAPKYPNYNANTGTNPNFDRYVESFLKSQVRELIEEFDPPVMWFDGEWIPDWTHEQGLDMYNYVRNLKPDILINNRVDTGRQGMQGMTATDRDYAGDFGTPEQEIPAEGLPGVDWESCMTINDTWGFKSYDDNWKSDMVLIRNLVDIASKGGNFLLNVGPTAEGIIPSASVERLAAMGDWLDVNGDAIYGTSASTLGRPDWGRYTTKSDVIYAHVFDWPADGRLVVAGLDREVDGVRLLGSPSNGMDFEKDGETLTVELPSSAPDSIASVLAIEME